MADPILSGTLAAALNAEVVNQAFDIAYSNMQGVMATVNRGTARPAEEGSKLNWLDMRVDAASSPLTAGINDSVTTVPVSDGGKFRVGMVVGADGSEEKMLVTAIATNNLTVTRGFGGTTAAAVTNGTNIIIDSIGREENSLAQNDGIFQPETRENLFQTFDTAIEFSRRALATLQHGNTNNLSFQVDQRMRQMMIQINRALISGRRATATIGSNEHTYSGGMKFWLSQADAINTDHSGAALTLEALNNLNAEIVSRGGTANTVAVGIARARQLNDLIAANYSSQRLADFMSDEGSVRRLPSDLPLVGNVTNIVVDTNIADTEVLIYDSSMISIIPMAANNANAGGDVRTLDATQPGQDGQRVRLITDIGFEIRQYQTHMARLHNVANS